ncbi:histidine kinase [Herbiconiux moechotypicola]|nr:histidine kinase [Herbiconiux moechotypicola]
MVATAIILVGRLRSADRAHLRVLLPLYLYGTLAVLAIPLSTVVLPPLVADPDLIGLVQLAVIEGIPIVFLLGVLFGGYATTGETEALSAWLGAAESSRAAVAVALSRSLGDESLRVVYWAGERSAFVGADGADAPTLDGDPHRRRQEVHVDSRLIGAIDYDSRIVGDPDEVLRAARVLAVALDRERLTAAVLATNEELLHSRLRLVETADRERTRIARDLHDGLQAQLVLLALEAQQLATVPGVAATTAEAATGLRRRIDDSAAELRRLVHGLLPSALVERGLSAAAEDLVDRLDLNATLDARIDDGDLDPVTARTAYLIVAEALTNAVKHSGADRVHVELSTDRGRLVIVIADDGRGGARTDTGTGLEGLANRVDALGGVLVLDSPAGEGTRVRVELPCES